MKPVIRKSVAYQRTYGFMIHRDPVLIKSVDQVKHVSCSSSSSKPSAHYLNMSKFGPQDAQQMSTTSSLAHQGNSIACMSSRSSTWILDSRATDHMTGMSDMFSSLQHSSSLSHITVANGTRATVSGIGTVIISPTITLSSVLYVPTCSFNLISIKKLIQDLHCSVVFSSSSVIIQDLETKATIGGGHAERGLYYLDVPVIPTSYSAVVSPLDIHCRLGHPSLETLKSMVPNL